MGHERWWSKPKSRDAYRQLDARRQRDPGRLRRARRRARTTPSGAPHPRGRPQACARQGLARGDSPLRSDVYALRARQLVERRSRERLAEALERLVERAERTPSPSAIVWLPKREIIDARTELLSLARRLRDARPVYACGVAMVSQLVCDGTGPAFTPRAGLALRRAIAEATVALEGMSRDEPVSQR